MQAGQRTRALELGATLYFVMSGGCALVYELIWFKRFTHVWGSSSLAMASVVASFLAGLGLGAWLIGARADRMARPLFAYGLCEIGIALWALCVPIVTPWCARIAALATPALEDHALALVLVRVSTTFLAISPACILMGATLPMLVRWLAARGRGVGRASAWLYAFNAAGAAAGAWIAGFHLLPAIGLDGTNLLTAAASALIGVLALVTDRAQTPTRPESASLPPSPRPVPSHSPAGESPADVPAPPAAVHAAAMLAGFGALSLQMLWGRELALLVGPTTYAFSALVVVFIAGLGAGSLCFALFGERLWATRRWIAIAMLLVVAGTIAGRLMEPRLALLAGSLRDQRASPLFNAVLCSGMSAALELVATFAMGIFFPALIALVCSGVERAGTSVGRIYAWNTLGSIAGALSAFTILVPWAGSEATAMIAMASYVGALLLVLAPRWSGREVELILALAAIAMIVSPWRASDPRATNIGSYLYAEAADTLRGEATRVLFFEEGASANVLVLEFDADENTPGSPPRVKNLRVNGKVDASNLQDMAMQLGAAYFSLLLRPDARSILVIGMGSGTTAGAALLFPGTEVTCCELEPSIAEAARAFAPENKNPHGSPRFRQVIDDGRNFVQSRESAFDLIISEPSNPWIAGVANLYTQDFYTTARSRLGRGGMFVQWLQTYGLSARQYALVANTALSVFEHVALLRINEFDTLLLCSSDPIVPDRARLDRSQVALDELTDVREDLLRYFGSADVRTLLLSVLMLENEGLRALCAAAGEGEVNTDANMQLEFRAPRDLFGMKVAHARPSMDAIYAVFDPRFTARLITGWGWTESQAQALLGHKRALASRGDAKRAFAMNELLLAWLPDDPAALADQLIWAPPQDLEEFSAAIAQLVRRSPVNAARVAKTWLDQNQFARARQVYRALLESMPDSPTVLVGLALCLVNLAEPEEARALLGRARRIDPLDGLVHDLERALEAK